MIALRRPALLLALCGVLAGCGSGDQANSGGSGSNGDNEVASSDAAEILQAKRTIDAACGSDGSGTPDRSDATITAAVSTLAQITSEYPDRVYETGTEDRADKLSDVASQVSTQLERCGLTDQAAKLKS